MGRFALLFLIFVVLPYPVAANESPGFQEPETQREKQAISISDNKGLIAKVDLNDDLIDEYIVRYCSDSKFCDYTVIAFKDFKAIKIGDFRAHKIVISHEKTYGVRDLIVYNQEYNDFAHEKAAWNPFRFYYHFNEKTSDNPQ